jgi:glutamine amidotransferase
MAKVAIVDYGMGNLRSVRNAVEYCGHDAVVSARREDISNASHMILPGVGAFGDAMENLSRAGLPEILECEVRARGKPLLAICLGMQLLARSSTEHAEGGVPHVGIGWLDAEIIRIPAESRDMKIPHMGWNELVRHRAHPVLMPLRDKHLNFYFVHSYWMKCNDSSDVVATVEYGSPITAIVARDNILGTQFHPEKSQDSGIELISGFLAWNP